MNEFLPIIVLTIGVGLLNWNLAKDKEPKAVVLVKFHPCLEHVFVRLPRRLCRPKPTKKNR